MHIEFLLEEPSAEACLRRLLPKLTSAGTTWKAIMFRGKADMLANLGRRLRGYRAWMPAHYKIVVLMDADRSDCRELKGRMEAAALAAGFLTKSAASTGRFDVLNRIAVEELEAWFFGDPVAMATAFPKLPSSLGTKSPYRNPDAIAGGTWEALERELRRAGYYDAGFPKIEVARKISEHMEPERNSSPSFQAFVRGLRAL